MTHNGRRVDLIDKHTYTFVIHWDGLTATLDEVISKELNKVSNGKWQHGQVTDVQGYVCLEHFYCYCRTITIKVPILEACDE
mgnify:CR=1 FL=1